MATPMYDTETTPFAVAAEDLLPVVTDANQRLAVSAEVPLDIVRVIERVADRLPLDDPTAGFAGVDPYVAGALLAGAAAALRALQVDEGRRRRRELRVALERVRQALAAIVEEAPVDEDRPVATVARWITEAIDVPQADLAGLLGVSTRTLQRWVAPGAAVSPAGAEAARLRAVARVAANLRHAFTGPGVLRWFSRPHPDLDGRPPAELLDHPERYPALVRLSAQARSHAAA